MKLNWTTIIVAALACVGTLVPCLLTNDAKQQNVYDADAKLRQAEADKQYLAGELAALRLILEERQPQPRHTARRARGGPVAPAPEPELPKTLSGETIRALAQADSAAKAAPAPARRLTPLRALARRK